MDKGNKVNPKSLAWHRKYLVIISAVAFIVGGLMLGLFFATKYKPLLLLAIIELLPVIVNLVLFMPCSLKNNSLRDKSAVNETDGGNFIQSESNKSKKNKTKNNKPLDFASLFTKYRAIICSVIILLLVAATNVIFWMFFRQTAPVRNITYFVAVAVIVTWIAFMVLEKLCKHILNDIKDREDIGEEAVYDLAIIKSYRSSMFVDMLSQFIVFVGVVLMIQNVIKSTNVIVIILSVIFAYQSLFMILSLISHFVRKQMNISPSIIIPIPGIGGEDLSVMNYLESNTGMTMRSLWSLKLIKKVLPYTLVAVVTLLWAFSGIVNVESYQTGALYRFGKLQDEYLQPGLHLTLPWGIDDVVLYDTGVVNKMTIGYSSNEDEDNMWSTKHEGEEYKLLLGGGHELVSINLKIEYKINDIDKYLRNSSSPEMILQATAYETITSKTIDTDIVTLLSADRAELASQLKSEITARAEVYNTGLEIVSVVLESIHPPVLVADIYQEIISAGIDAERQIIVAEEYAAKIIAEAKTNKESTINFEKKLAFESVAEAKAAVAEFMASVEADNTYGDQYRYNKYLKALADAYSGGKIIIVGDGVDQKNIYIGSFIG